MSGEKKVLIIDDQQSVLDLFKLRLEAVGFQVFGFTSPEKGLEVVNTTELVAVLLDLNLDSGMDGFDVLKEIQAVRPVLPVIVVTGLEDEATARKALSLGAYDYISKPVDFEHLTSTLSLMS